MGPRSHDSNRMRAASGGALESGNAMIIALLVLILLTTAGITFVAVTKSEKQISSNQQTNSSAFYTAEAGITEGLYRMSYQNDSTNYIGPATPAVGWGRYIVLHPGDSSLDPNRAAEASDGIDNNGDGVVDEPGEHYPEVASKQTASSALKYPYVKVEYKVRNGQLVRFGDADGDPTTPPTENLTTGEPVLRITASGLQGNAKKVIEAEAVKFPIVTVNSAIWAGGPLKLNGNGFIIDGHDHDMSAPYDTVPGNPPVEGVLTQGPATDVPMNSQQMDNVSGAGGDASVQQSSFAYDFNSLWKDVSSIANQYYPTSTNFTSASPTFGSMATPKVLAVNGSVALSGGWNGYGILIVNGDLSMTGGSQWTGIVIVTGDIKMSGGGPADVSRIVGSAIFQSSLIDKSSAGGSADIIYSSEAVKWASGAKGYTLSWWREL